MSNKVIKLAKNEILFREGEASHAMYLIKSGRIAITRSNPAKDKEAVLSEKVHGELLGEMAFFDNQTRSAGARALVPSELIELPFKSLQEQLKDSPMWLNVMVKTIVTQLRKANVRIRNLENITEDTYEKISPQTLLHICTIVHLLTYKATKNAKGQAEFTYKDLFFYARHAFNQRGQKLKRVISILQDLNILQVSGEVSKKLDDTNAQQTVTVLDANTLAEFVHWYSGHIATNEAERIVIEPEELETLRVLVHYLQGQKPDAQGAVKLNLTAIEESALKDTGLNFKTSAVEALSRKGLVRPKTHENGEIVTSLLAESVKTLTKFWSIVILTGKPFS